MKKLLYIFAVMCLTAACGDGKNDGSNENGGVGVLTNSLANSTFSVASAAQTVTETANPDVKACRLSFHSKDGKAADLPLTLFVNKQFDKIQPGTYLGISYSDGSVKDTYFYVHQKGDLGEVYYYNDANGGSITVSEKAGVYTVLLDINVTADSDPTSAPGKITGTYTGSIVVVSPK